MNRSLRVMLFLVAPLILGGVNAVPALAAGQTVCSPGFRSVNLSSTNQTNILTHVSNAITMAPGTGFAVTRTVTWTDTVSAGINGTIAASAYADFIIFKLGVSTSLALQASGSVTKQSSYSETWTLNNNTTHQRVYAFLTGTRRVTANYAYKECNSRGDGWGPTDYGTVKSWTVKVEGTALCPHTSYSSGSLESKALVAIGC